MLCNLFCIRFAGSFTYRYFYSSSAIHDFDQLNKESNSKQDLFKQVLCMTAEQKNFSPRFKASCLRPVAIRICMKRIFDNSIMSLCLSIYCQVTIAPKSTQNILGPTLLNTANVLEWFAELCNLRCGKSRKK